MKSLQSKKHERWEEEPWLIASSMNYQNADKMMHFYQKRMQLVEAFRDLKSTSNELGMRHCRSFSQLSNFTIGWQVLKRPDIRFCKKELLEALRSINASIREVIYG